MIVRAFRTKYGEDPEQVDYLDRLEMDQQIGRVRERLVEEGDHGDLSLYDEPLRSIWQPEPPPNGNGNGGEESCPRLVCVNASVRPEVWVLSAGSERSLVG